jgi:multidrug efflux system membrane fusion protein
MKRSYLIAAGVTAAAVVWIATGTIHSGGDAPPEEVARAQGPADGGPVAVRVETLHAQKHVHEITVTGRTKADRLVEVTAETAGRVVETPLEKGSVVAKGDVLVKLDVEDRRATLRAAEAEVERRRIAYEAALKLSQKEYRSKVKLAEEKALLEQAKAALAAARLSLSFTTVSAPVDGILEDRLVDVGDYRKVGDPLAVIVDLDPIEVGVEISERDVDSVHAGTPARVRLISGREVQGAVRYVSRASTNTARTYSAEVTVPNTDGTIRAGMTAEVVLEADRVDAHRISPAILTLNDAGVVGLKIVDENDTVRFVEGTLVADTPDGFWVGGLPAIVRVITVGQEFVKVGQRVRPVERN